MYCKNCGKIISEGALFCTFCGAKAEIPAEPHSEGTENAAETAPESVSQPVQETSIQDAAPASASAAEPAQNTQSVHSASVIPAPIDTSAPRPAASIYSGISSTPVQNPISSSIEFRPEKAENAKPEKHFTWLHIGLCLAAVAVMAIVAGIFAGLYFSLL